MQQTQTEADWFLQSPVSPEPSWLLLVSKKTSDSEDQSPDCNTNLKEQFMILNVNAIKDFCSYEYNCIIILIYVIIFMHDT